MVRQHLADALGMDPGKIWGNTWTWLESLHLRPEHAAAIDAAAQRSAGADTPVKPFRGHLTDCLAHAGEFRAEREQQAAAAAAEAEAEQQAAEQAVREEQERQEKAERDRLEREKAQAEFDRLAPELDALVVRYSLGREKGAANELREARLTRDPRDKLRILQQKIDWFRNELEGRERRAPLVARCLEYIGVNPGTCKEEMAEALGADPDEVREAMSDLLHHTKPVPVRGEWVPCDDGTGRVRREIYYLTGE